MKIKIKKICEITSSKRIFAGEYQNTGIPFYRGKEITQLQSGSKDISDLIYIANQKYEEIKLKYGVPVKGDILLTSVGTIGNPYYVPNDSKFYFKDGNLTWFRNFRNVESKYLYYWLLSPVGKHELGKSTIGSSQKAYTISLLNEMEIELPDLPTQQKIASILSTYDDLIEINEKRIKILEEMAERLYTEWFVHFRFPGHEKAKLVDSHTSFGMIPEGWEVKKLGDIANEKRNQINPDQVQPNSPYVGLEHIPRKSIVLNDWGRAMNVRSDKFLFKVGDILFGKIRPYFHKVVTAPIEGISSTDTIVISPINADYKPLILMIVSSKEFVNYSTITSQGTKMPRADWKTLAKYQVAVPKVETLDMFNKHVNNYVDEMNNLMFKNKKLESIRDLLIPKLTSGKRI